MSPLPWRETFSVAIEAIGSNRARSALTMISVVIGVASIVFSVSAGTSLGDFIEGQLESLGSNLMWIRTVEDETDTSRRSEPFTFEDAEALKHVPGIHRVGPRASKRTVFSYNQRHLSGDLLGVSPDYFAMRNKKVAYGRSLIEADLEHRRRVCVVAPGVVDRLLYQTQSPLGKAIKIDGKPFVVVGVLAPPAANLKTPGLEEDEVVFVPLPTGMRLFGLQELDFLFFQPEDPSARGALRQRIHQLVLLRKGPQASYEIDSLEERRAQIENLIWVVALVFGSIAGVSLVVAGIGIMNIMLLSIMERTREIGIRKSVGARRRDILAQFFGEALLLSGGGGAIGVFTGAAGTAVLSLLTSGVITLSIGAALTAFLFALATGVFFGLYPAMQAARLEPVRALAVEVG